MKNKIKKHTLPALHKACSTDDIRPALMYVMLKNGVFTATDGHVMARCIYEAEDFDPIDKTVYIHHRVAAAMYAALRFCIDYDCLTVYVTDKHGITAKYEILDEAGFSRSQQDTPSDIKYPDFMRVIPTLEQFKSSTGATAMSINDKYYTKAIQAAGLDPVTVQIHIWHQNKAIVLVDDSYMHLALIMPRMISEHFDALKCTYTKFKEYESR